MKWKGIASGTCMRSARKERRDDERGTAGRLPPLRGAVAQVQVFPNEVMLDPNGKQPSR
jgi:hypothetical protein